MSPSLRIKPPKNPGPAPTPVPPVQTANLPGQQNAASGYGGMPGNQFQQRRGPRQGADPIQLSRNSRIPRGGVRTLGTEDVAVGFVSGPSAPVEIHTRVQPPPDMSEEQVALLAELQAQAGTGVGYLPTPGTPETLHRSSLSYPGQADLRGVDVYMPDPPMIDGGNAAVEP